MRLRLLAFFFVMLTAFAAYCEETGQPTPAPEHRSIDSDEPSPTPEPCSIDSDEPSPTTEPRSIDGERPSIAPRIKIGPASLALFGYAQTLYTYTHSDHKSTNGFDIQRIILMADARIMDRLSFFLMFDAASGQLHEYYAQYAFLPGLKLRIGQFKQPYTLENILPPTILSNINFDPSVLYMTGIATDPGIGNHTARDAGLMLTGDLFPHDGRPLLNYQIGVFNGTGRNVRENNNQKSVIGMVNYMPVKGLTLSASGAVGTSRAENDRFDYYGKPVYVAGQNYSRIRTALGVEWSTRMLNLRSEWMYGKDARTAMVGGYVNLEFRIVPKKFDIIANFDILDKNISCHSNENVYTYIAGAQYWVYKRCRVLTQFVHTRPSHRPVTNQWITQFQIAF